MWAMTRDARLATSTTDKRRKSKSRRACRMTHVACQAFRDALLPKLMSGEIDVEKVKVA